MLKLKNLINRFFSKSNKNTPSIFSSYLHENFLNLQPRFKNYEIGDFSYGCPQIFDWSEYDDVATQPTKLRIGKFCSLADVKIILGSEHRLDWVTTYPFNALNDKFRHIKGHPKSNGNIVIGNDVWIASGVTILSGVTIGDGAVIGANALVTKDIASYSVATGMPACTIKNRFPDHIIERLIKIKWWNLPIELIEKHVELLQSNNIEEFIISIEKHTTNK